MPHSHNYDGMGLFSDKLPVILEIGNLFTKAGFAHDPSPRCIIPSSVTVNQNPGGPGLIRYLSDFKNEQDLYYMFVDFIRSIYSRYLLVNPVDRNIVIVEPVFAKTVWRNTLAKVLYLHFNAPNILWYPYQLAATNAIGSQTALVVDFGLDEINVIPVIHGCTLLNHIQTIGLGTKAFDKNLNALLLKHCTDLPSEELSKLITEEILQNIRVNACFVGKFNRKESNNEPKLKPFQYQLDGSNSVYFDGILREEPAELWFQNEDLDGESLPVVILETLKRIPIDNRKLLASSILLTGGLSLIPGLKPRLVRELNHLYKSFHENFSCGGYEFKFFEPPCSEVYLGWLGGSHCASIDYISLQGVSRDTYLEIKGVPDWCMLRGQIP